MSKTNQTRREKYHLLRQAGYSSKEAAKMRGWSYGRIREHISLSSEQVDSRQERYEQTNYDDWSRSEQLTYKRRLLRSVGFSPKEATKLRTKPLEYILDLIALKQDKQPEKSDFNYLPFDKAYRHDYAYRVNFNIIYDKTEQREESDRDIGIAPEGTIQKKTWTIVHFAPLSKKEVINLIWKHYLNKNSHYGSSGIEIISITPMFAGLGRNIQ